MKNSSLTTKLITAFIFLAVMVYFGIQTWRYFTDPIITSSVYVYRSEQAMTLNGMLVRDEEIIDCSEPLVELTRTEGERVANGKRIATVYQSAEALSAEQEVAALREQLEQLRYAQTAARDTEAALRLDSDIEGDIIAVRAALTSGNYTALGSNVSALKSTVLRREYAYRGSADLSDRIASLESRLRETARSAGDGSRAIVAPFAGTYSAVADGYETVLTPDMLPKLSPSEFERLLPAPVSTTVGKLVRGETWYYVAAVDASDAVEIAKGGHYELAITGVDVLLPVVASSVSRAEDGRCLVVFSGEQYLSYVTALRDQSAELILKSCTGLRIPKNALRIHEGQSGVYCRIGRQAWFKPVEVIYQGEDYCLVRPGEINAARESDVVFYTLRTGDEAIITADRLYNGKVID